jgi:hypothetical protein
MTVIVIKFEKPRTYIILVEDTIIIRAANMTSCKTTQLKTLTSEAMVNIEHTFDNGNLNILITLLDPCCSREKCISDLDIFHFVWMDNKTYKWFNAYVSRKEFVEMHPILNKPKDLMATLETQPAIKLLGDGTYIVTFNVNKGKRSYPIDINLKCWSENRRMMIEFVWESVKMCDKVVRLEDDLHARDIKRKLAEYEVAADARASHV